VPVRPRQPPAAARDAIAEALRRAVAGVDEAAVLLEPGHGLEGLDDSKRLPRERRERLFDEIREHATCWHIEVVGVGEIERENILQATLNGMRRSVLALDPEPELVMVDGNRAPELGREVITVVEGDHWVPAISAASILAKVHRDRLMREYHESWPDYGFDRHKGYPTQEHLQKLREKGPCPIHRRGFAPVRALLEPSLF
jgi:ribonuclease HII